METINFKEGMDRLGIYTSWDHMVMDQSRNTQHQVHPWQLFSINKSKWQTKY